MINPIPTSFWFLPYIKAAFSAEDVPFFLMGRVVLKSCLLTAADELSEEEMCF